MPKLANFDFIRLISRDSDFLDRRVGSRGELALGNDGYIRLFSGGDTQGGQQLVVEDLSNVSNEVFAAKVAAAGVSGGGASVDVAETAPSEPESGNLWLNTTNGILYIYIDDGDTSQWVQPDVPKPNSILDLGITDGSNGQALITDGAGSFSFSTVATSDDITTATANSTNWDTAYSWGDHSAAGYLTEVAANSITPTELNITGNGTAGQALLSDGDGSFSWGNPAGTGAVTFAGTIIDTDDSSSIGIVPAVVMGSDLTVQNDLVVDNNITTTNITVNGNIETQGSGTPELASDNEILLTATTRVTLTSSPIKMASFTTTERNALTPSNGDIIYNTTDNKFQGYENGAWVNLI
jgi:hypothetical protein